MLFPTFEFLAFFAAALALNWLLKRWPLLWRLFLLLASYFFYILWDARFLAVLVLVSLFNYVIGILIERDFHQSRRFAFTCGVIANLTALGFFKYYDFFRLSSESFLRYLGLSATLPFLDILLPIGISFYAFRAIAYLADVYRKKTKAEKSWLDFFIFIAFFPYLLAGPIARASEFLGQLKDGGAKKIDNFYHYFSLIFLGLFKKLVLSSFLVLNLTDDVFMVPENHSALGIFLAVIAYTLVIYFDFSGYSDLAVGFAGLLGFRSPLNFEFPYLALNLKTFWRRWHITLCSWIRDYIYIPLGGNRKGFLRRYFNLVFTMVVAGLWHGASVLFMIWGLWHGLGLAVNHLWQDWRKKWFLQERDDAPEILLNTKDPKSGLTINLQVFKGRGKRSIIAGVGRFLAWLLTFCFVAVGWIFFRSETWDAAWQMLRGLFNFSQPVEPISLLVAAVIMAGLVFIFLEKPLLDFMDSKQRRAPVVLWFLMALLIMVIIFKLGPETVPPFIYFSF